MPNGRDLELPQIQAKSRLWGVVWQIGDAAYYLPIFIMVFGFPVAMGAYFRQLGWSLQFVLKLGIVLLILLACFPTGIAISLALKSLARWRTGVSPH